MTETNKGGRPQIHLTQEQIAQVEGLAAVLSVEQMADFFGIARKTFYNIMEREPEVFARYHAGRAKAVGVVGQGVLQEARDGNLQAAMFYLRTQAGWSEKTVVEGGGKPLKIEFGADDAFTALGAALADLAARKAGDAGKAGGVDKQSEAGATDAAG